MKMSIEEVSHGPYSVTDSDMDIYGFIKDLIDHGGYPLENSEHQTLQITFKNHCTCNNILIVAISKKSTVFCAFFFLLDLV